MSKIKLFHCKGTQKKDCLEYPNDIDIYYDDTITDIKRKIIMNANLNVTTDEIYLFGRFKNNIHPDVVFDSLTKNKKHLHQNLRVVFTKAPLTSSLPSCSITKIAGVTVTLSFTVKS